jgi:hypothetical protein
LRELEVGIVVERLAALADEVGVADDVVVEERDQVGGCGVGARVAGAADVVEGVVDDDQEVVVLPGQGADRRRQ